MAPPNIILILTDDQGYGELGCNGNPILKTPNLDRFHEQSTRFINFHVSPTCSPSRAALLTGKHEFLSGVTHTIFGRERLSLDSSTLADLFTSYGYRTSIFGKWHLGDDPEYLPDRRGFHEALIHLSGGLGQFYFGDRIENAFTPYDNPTLYHNGRFVDEKGYCTNIFFTRALEWIDANKGSPFFVYLSTNTPHAPMIVDKKYALPYRDGGLKGNWAKYYGMIANIDENIGKFMARIKELGLEKTTLVIFMTDNGHAAGVGTAGGAGHDEDGFLQPEGLFNAGMRGGKSQPWEGGTRVPCFFRWPGVITPGKDINQLAAHIDILPTIADICGFDIPEEWGVEGRSLYPLLKNQNNDWMDRYLVTHVARWKKGKARQSKYNNMAILSKRFRFVNNEALYDIADDPGETKNIIHEHPDVVADMRAFYDHWWEDALPHMVND
jgi:arylsulfatase